MRKVFSRLQDKLDKFIGDYASFMFGGANGPPPIALRTLFQPPTKSHLSLFIFFLIFALRLLDTSAFVRLEGCKMRPCVLLVNSCFREDKNSLDPSILKLCFKVKLLCFKFDVSMWSVILTHKWATSFMKRDIGRGEMKESMRELHRAGGARWRWWPAGNRWYLFESGGSLVGVRGRY